MEMDRRTMLRSGNPVTAAEFAPSAVARTMELLLSEQSRSMQSARNDGRSVSTTWFIQATRYNPRAQVGLAMCFVDTHSVRVYAAQCGFLVCDGSEYNPEQYRDLFLAIGDKHGVSKKTGRPLLPDYGVGIKRLMSP